MDVFGRDQVKNELLKLLEQKPDANTLDRFLAGLEKKVTNNKNHEILWGAIDFVKTKKPGSLNVGIAIAEQYADPNRKGKTPSADFILDEKIKKGEEVEVITTDRGVSAWLVQAVLGGMDTGLFDRAIAVIDKLSKDKSPYVVQQSIIPLEFLCANLTAEKFPDGTVFNFTDEQRKKVRNILDAIINSEHGRYPAVLKYAARAVFKMREIDDEKAQAYIKNFLYSDKSQTITNPDFVLEVAIPLLLRYSLFGLKEGDTSTDQYIKLLKEFIGDAGSRALSILVWHMWKVLDMNKKGAEAMQILRKMELFWSSIFDRPLDNEVFGQLDFLVRRIEDISQEMALDVFEKYINSVKNFAKIQPLENRRLASMDKSQEGLERKMFLWLHDTSDLFERFSNGKDLQRIKRVFLLISEAHELGVYIGDFNTIIKRNDSL